MKNSKILIALFSLIFLTAWSQKSLAQTIAYVETEKVVPEMDSYKKANSEVEAYGKQLQKVLEKKQADLQKYYAEVSKAIQEGTMTPQKQQEAEAKLQKMQTDLQQEAQQADRKLVEKEAEFTFCFISHPFWLKGLPYLLEAWKIANLKNCKLRIGGRLDQQLQHYITKNYSDLENIEYTGWVKDLNSFYRSSNVCVVPSLLDAGPTTVTEAMYCKLPVIVTSSCGSHTLVNNHKNGFVISPKNAQEISDKMIWFNENRNMVKQMGEDANKAIANLSDYEKQKELSDFLIKMIDKSLAALEDIE